MKILVTGGAGFIGSNLVDRLLREKHEVRVIDNFSTGQFPFIDQNVGNPNFEYVTGDLRDVSLVDAVVGGVDVVVHLAANADVRHGWEDPRRDIEQNLVVTQNVLEGMRKHGVRRLVFSSTGSVYGEATQFPIPESCPFPSQTSLYGASKVAAEGVISAYAEAGFVDATIFRFVSILGPRYTHGHVIDFVRQLMTNSTELTILGNGRQRKSYLHVADCVNAITLMLESDQRLSFYNLGVADFCTVDDSASWICAAMNVEPRIIKTGGDRGWVGDNPFIFLDTSRMTANGWTPEFGIKESVLSTVGWLLENSWVFDRVR